MSGPALSVKANIGMFQGSPMGKGRLQFRIPSHAAIRAKIFARDGFSCVLCGWSPGFTPQNYTGRYTVIGPDLNGKRRELQLDHKIPVSLGGTNHPDNFQSLCFGCNSAKRDRII